MVDYIAVGQFSIPIGWLAFIVATLYVDYRQKTINLAYGPHIDRLVFIYIAIWKGSYIVFELPQVLKAPLSILYFDGGLKGHLVALIALIAYVISKKLQSVELIHAFTQFIAVYMVVFYSLTGTWIVAIICLMLLLVIEFRYHSNYIAALALVLVYMVGWDSYFVIAIVLLIVVDVIQTKKPQLAATTFIACLLAIVLSTAVTTINADNKSVTSHSIILPTTAGELMVVDDIEESIIVVNFFATWCPPCNAEMPHLTSFQDNLPLNTLLIGINLAARDNGEQALTAFTEKHAVNYPILLDNEDKYGKLYHIRSIPTTIILKDGVEMERIIGPISEEGLKRVLNRIQ